MSAHYNAYQSCHYDNCSQNGFNSTLLNLCQLLTVFMLTQSQLFEQFLCVSFLFETFFTYINGSQEQNKIQDSMKVTEENTNSFNF